MARLSSTRLPPQMEAVDYSDGTWSVYDPGSRLTADASLITGTHKNRIRATFPGTAQTVATGVTYYRKIRKPGGGYPSNERGIAHRISLSWASRLNLTAATRVIMAAGYSNGPPTTGTSIAKLYGLVDGTGNSQLNVRIVGTAASSTYTEGGTNVPSLRAIHVLMQRLSLQGAMQVLPAMATDGHRDTSGGLVNTYTHTANEEMGAEAEIYEWHFYGTAAAGATLDFYVAGESGLVSPADAGYHYTPQWGGAYEPLNVYVAGDSTWYGGASGTGVTGGSPTAPGVQRAFNEFALRRTNGRRRRPVRFVGFTGSPIGTAGTRHMIDGQADTGTVSGRTLVDEVAAVAGRMTSLSNAGRDLRARGGQPDVYLLVLGINDANNLGRTAAQMRADIVTIAAAVKAEFPACEVWFAALYAPGVTEYVALKAGIAAALPANVDRVIDFSTWWTPAFHISAIDGHYTLPANPTNLDAWNGPYSMNPAGANYSQHGVCAFAYAVYHALLGERPPLLSGEVAPY